MTLQDFVDYYTKGGEADVTFSGVSTDQCMCLMHAYIYQVLNLTDKLILAQPNAYQVYDNFDNEPGKGYFQRIANSPTNFPSPGDIVIFNQKVGISGHVAICLEADANSLTTFDSNWDNDTAIGIKPHIVKHSYTNAQGEPEVSGWLRLIPQQPQVSVTDIQTQLKQEADALTQCTQQNQTLSTQLTDKTNAVATLTSSNNDLQSKHDQLQNEVIALNTEIASFTNNRLDYATQLKQSADANSKLTEYLQTIAVHTIGDPKNKPLDQVTAEVMLNASQQDKKISDLQQEMKKYTDMKNAFSQTTNALPPSPIKNFLTYVKGLIIVQP